MSGQLILILGGARGGKSSYAQTRALELGGPDVLYVATAQALDEEMISRIAAHKAERPQGWRTLEAPTLLGAPLLEEVHGARVVLVDCLTLLVSNAMLAAGAESVGEGAAPVAGAETVTRIEAAVEAEVDTLLAAAGQTEATWIVVSNEVGLGIVPDNPLARAYRDALGRANQRVAAVAGEAVLMVAGLPLGLK